MSIYDTSALLATIKTKALIPTNQSTFTSSQLLTLCDEEIQVGIVPMIMAAREEYFVTYKEYAMIGGQNIGYQIPSRAIGGKLSDVTILDSSGAEYSIPFLPADQVNYVEGVLQTYQGVYCFLRGNKLMITYQNSNPGTTLRLYYFQRPNKLVETTAVGVITGIDTVSNTVTCNQVPGTIYSSIRVDFVQAEPGFDSLATDQVVQTTGPGTLTFSSLPTNLAIGDYVCLAGEAPVAQIPFEFSTILTQRVVVKVLEALGDERGSGLAASKLKEIEANVLNLVTPRIEGEPKKITNRFSPLRGRNTTPNGAGYRY